MRKITTKQKNKPEADLLPHYDLDYRKGKKNPYAKLLKGTVVSVPLDEDVASVFKNAVEVNTALRALIQAMPRSNGTSRRSKS